MSHELAASSDATPTELLSASTRVSFPDEHVSAPSDYQLGVAVAVDGFGSLEDLIVEESTSAAAAAGDLTADGADWIVDLDLTDGTSLIVEADLADELAADEAAATQVNQAVVLKPDFAEQTLEVNESNTGDENLAGSGYTLGDADFADDFLLDALQGGGDVDFASIGLAGDEFDELLVDPAAPCDNIATESCEPTTPTTKSAMMYDPLGNHVAPQLAVTPQPMTPQQGHVAVPSPSPLQSMRISLLQLPPGLVLRRCGGSEPQGSSAPFAPVASSAPAARVAPYAVSLEMPTSDESPLGKRKRDLESSPALNGNFQQQQQPAKVSRVDPPSPVSAVLAANEELEVDSGSAVGVLWEALEQQMKPARTDETPCQCLACQCKSEEDRRFLLTGKRMADADAGAGAGSKRRPGWKRKGRSMADGNAGDSMADVNEILGELAQIPLLLDLKDLPELPEGDLEDYDLLWDGADVAVLGVGGDFGLGLGDTEGKHSSGFGRRLSQMDVTEVVAQCRVWLHEALQSPGCDSIDVDFCLKVVGEVQGEAAEETKAMELAVEDALPLECSME
ncbi:hypothetical protein CLOM_g4556 [Closterium sp. NIES-68]|nr:hypothetical protein CLOM_g2862 [Closterium sp. NIES-68]GJP45143.1 hypothetical protein CLOM_g4556 [Closterium sp. NIES-68]GJP70057.1 hypothetical protein CLOP_g1047 [Closterium sp. NIES-67]GJP75771.1 hypothetical protein CLOP_g6174 [Closterium sp. NIES-67]